MNEIKDTLPSDIRDLAIDIFKQKYMMFIPPWASDADINRAIEQSIKIAKALLSI